MVDIDELLHTRIDKTKQQQAQVTSYIKDVDSFLAASEAYTAAATTPAAPATTPK